MKADTDDVGHASPIGRATAAVVFAAVLIGVPLSEGLRGVYPGVGIDGSADADAWLNGRATELVEQQMQRRSRVAADVRPYYNAAMFRLFEHPTPSVVVGDDGWLFLASTLSDRSQESTAASLAESARLMGRLSDWFDAQGTRLVVLPVPNKATVCAEKLSRRKPPFRPHYHHLTAALRDADLRWVDVLPALSTEEASTYRAPDTHWTPSGAVLAAEAVAEDVRRRGLTLVGPERAFSLREGDLLDVTGDLVVMLGVESDDGLAARFRERVPSIEVVDDASGDVLPRGGVPGADIVWAGTSFSALLGAGNYLAAALNRPVHDESLFGQGPVKAMLGVAEQMRRGERSAPSLLVWEFPERYAFLNPALLQEPLRQFLAGAEYRVDAPLPFPVARRTFERLTLLDETEGWLDARPDGDAPAIVYTLEAPLPGDGTFAVTFEVTATRMSQARVRVDVGDGWEVESESVRVLRRNAAERVVAPLRSVTGAPILRVRIEPVTEWRKRSQQEAMTFRCTTPVLWGR